MGKVKKVTLTKDNMGACDAFDISLMQDEFIDVYKRFARDKIDFKCEVSMSLNVGGSNEMAFQREYKVFAQKNVFDDVEPVTYELILTDIMDFIHIGCLKKLSAGDYYAFDKVEIKFSNNADSHYEVLFSGNSVLNSYIIYKYYDCGDVSFKKHLNIELED